MVDSHYRKHLRRTFRLVSLYAHLVTRDLLVIFLAENGDDVERSAPGESDGDQFNGLGPTASGRVIQQ